MWLNLQGELNALLGERIYPDLLTDPGYRVLLRNAGIASIRGVADGTPVGKDFAAAQVAWGKSQGMVDKVAVPSNGNLTPVQRKNLRKAADLCTRLMLMDLEVLDGLEPESARARLLRGSESIYRVWDSTSDNQTRHWWFSQALKDKAVGESRQQGMTPIQWIRDALAISLDFGKCDRISRLPLVGMVGIPIIEGSGLPKPQRMTIHRDASGKTRGQADPDYWERLGRMFVGKETQYFIPFLPPDRIRPDTWS